MIDSDRSAALFLRDVQAEFLQILPERIREMEGLLESITRGSRRDEDLEDLHRLAHSLTGEGATFGFRLISDAARELERHLKSLIDTGLGSEGDVAGRIRRQIREILNASRGYSIDRLPDLPNRFSRSVAPPLRGSERLIFLVDDDEKLAKAMAVQLRHYGYQVMVFVSLRGLREQIEEHSPATVIMDIVFAEGDLAGVDFIAGLRAAVEEPMHVVFISRRSDIEARLQAYRAGADAYFTKPIDINVLAERLEILTGRQAERPYEILIVDDDDDVSSVYALELERAGMVATVVAEPMEALARIDAARPDLILLDVYMPHCSGPELAAVLRQHESYFSIPIVFLSAEGDFDQQVEALAQGGDEFLTKPVDSDHLVALVRSRAQHGRALESRMYQDGLTGLMNYSKQTQQLMTELKRASREGTPLAFVMSDLDDFKTINDTWGHAAGDRVLRSVAGIFKKRLRQSDLIARYGGDEYAVVLPNTTAGDAKRLFEEICASFAQLSHLVGDQRFTTSLSCGISAFPEQPTLERLAEAADRALYRSKSEGGNRVTVVAEAGTPDGVEPSPDGG